MARSNILSAGGAESSNANETTSITQLPANILEAFIPGYSIISRFLLEVLGFDITIVVSVCFIIFGLATSCRFLGNHALSLFRQYLTSSISIESDDDIYEQIMDWLAEHQMSKESRSLTAKTGKSSWHTEIAGEADYGIGDDGMLLNFKNWDSKIPPRFQPHYGSHRFWHNGALFELKRDPKEKVASNPWNSYVREEETLRLTCIGRSTQPIKDLLKVCQEAYFAKKDSLTVVRRPATKEMRMRGRVPWNKVATRPSRPMDTVVLDKDEKEQILADINEYLHPSSPRWYANRGIPYRRGYLFYGAPGTGKTSLSFAIAGIFGLDIYCISLLEPTLTEEDLGMLFNGLPRRCVVLLEDIDSAGLVKRNEEEDTPKDKSKASDESAKIGAEIAKAIKSASDKNDKTKPPQGISLSGLLNAIDGVASHEGRVLIMTTNHPEKLDEALIRPGRVDMKVGFKMATRSQIQRIFVRMYSVDEPISPAKAPISPVAVANGHVKSHLMPLTPPATPGEKPIDTLEDIAIKFADHIPESTFTPAEVQGFLLTRKKDPMKALKEVEEWRDNLLEAKASKSKLTPT
ncbi:MAG: hypothetical protein MMC33_007556 [Icmadophila ericetorum]|nr:hypothetical protein [Icmadophila ericetorum]